MYDSRKDRNKMNFKVPKFDNRPSHHILYYVFSFFSVFINFFMTF